MHPDLKRLIELHQVDSNLAALDGKIGAIPSRIQALEGELTDFLQVYEQRKHRLIANQKDRRALESEIQSIQSKISRHKDQLYEVKTNEQYRAMLKEIEGEEANIRKIEDQILEEMLEAEQLEKQIREAAGRLESEKARVESEVRRLESERQAGLHERERLLARRHEVDAQLNETVRNTYERVRAARHGVAVAEVRDGSCTGCHVLLRPQLYNEVRTNEAVLLCENCSRILYWVEAEPATQDETGEQRGQAAVQN